MKKKWLSSIGYSGIWMKTSGAIIIFHLVCNLFASSRPIIIPENPNWTATFIKELEILENPNKSISLESLLQDPEYFKFGENNLKHDDLQLHYWARCQFIMEGKDEAWISMGSNYWDSVTIYLVDSNRNIEQLNVGILQGYPISKKLFSANHLYTAYVSFDSKGKFRRESNINLVAGKTIAQLKHKGFTNYLDGILAGIMFGLAMYNLFLFFSIRDKIYFWYSAYILGCFMIYITLFSDSPSHFVEYFTRSNPFVAFYIKKFGDVFTWLFYAQFTRLFLDSPRTLPKWDLAIKISMIIVLLQLFINFAGIYQFTGTGRVIIWNIMCFTCFITGIVSYFTYQTNAKYFLAGQLFVMVGFVITFLSYAKIDFLFFLPKTELFNYFRSPQSLFFMIAVESILFSFALGSKYNALQKDIVRVRLEKEQEKQALLKSQNQKLEKDVVERTQDLSLSLASLKATQTQLIQSEKMASLGELTAGIAHEIQNPLNFINNFSIINKEILHELNEDHSLNENFNDELKHLFHQVSKNSEIINNHGKRIDSIVKSMLQHSHHGSSKEEYTDIHALCEECLKLAFHSSKVKDKLFNVNYEVKFDSSIPKINTIKPDLNRVLLNLINNAFYACKDKEQRIKSTVFDSQVLYDNPSGSITLNTLNNLNLDSEAKEQNKTPNDSSIPSNPVMVKDYRPKVTLSTRSIPNWIEISILDNGCGIPESIIEKIFQPFFTTKPSGDGTGLGLSLAYDMITKGMGGKLSVKSDLGEYSEFIISLPIHDKKPELISTSVNTHTL
ncbi:MAG: 7TM diverse intracellular signaling domain-containing protein [Saprospiraceae bacterium]